MDHARYFNLLLQDELFVGHEFADLFRQKSVYYTLFVFFLGLKLSKVAYSSNENLLCSKLLTLVGQESL